MVLKLDKLMGNVERILFLRKKLIKELFIKNNIQYSPLKNTDIVEKVFHLYENQRWWLGMDWIPLLLFNGNYL